VTEREVTIQRLGHRGDGVAEGPVFVPRVLPGEVVRGLVESDRMPAPKIVTPVPDRVAAPCPHYARCGGCALQHASDGFVAAWKQQVVAEALRAQGLTAPFAEIAVSPPGARRRAVLAGRRLKKGVLVGFHTRASDTIVPVPDCTVLDPRLRAALPGLEAVVALAGSRSATLDLAVTATDAGVDVSVTGGKPADAALTQALAEVARTHDLARLTLNGETVAARRPPLVSFDGLTVRPPPGAFLQATPQGEAALRAGVAAAVGDATRIVDLFAGCGTFALPLARQAAVHAVEGEGALLAVLDRGWREAGGLHKLTTETRDLFRRPLMAEELAKAGAVVIDPPRAGAEAQTAELARARVPRIAFVSCNPVTFARDARTLVSAGYRLDRVQVVDQFRWSSHVELVAALSLAHMG
jgi:23S rRNA (uracil1939-C5)-methyltransferase